MKLLQIATLYLEEVKTTVTKRRPNIQCEKMESDSDLNTTLSNLTFHLNMTDLPVNKLFRNIVVGLNMYGLPVLIIIGIVGNILSLVVFLTTRLRQQSISVYLAFLNVVDTLFLLCIGVIWLGWVKVMVMNMAGWCQITVYLSYVSGFLSVWTVVGFTVERFIVVYFPLMRVVYCTRKRALVVVASLAGGCLLLYNFALWTAGPYDILGSKKCMTFPSYEPLVRILSTIDTLITLVLPSLTIIVLNMLIARKLWRFRRMPYRKRGMSQQELTLSTQYVSARGDNPPGVAYQPRMRLSSCDGRNQIFAGRHPYRGCRGGLKPQLSTSPKRSPPSLGVTCVTLGNHGQDRGERTKCCMLGVMRVCCRKSRAEMTVGNTTAGDNGIVSTSHTRLSSSDLLRRHYNRPPGDQMRTTRSLLVISSVFVILNLPSHAFRVWVTFTYLNDASVVFSQTSLLWQLVFQFLYYANFSVNFFMYCACSRMFRSGLRCLMGSMKERVVSLKDMIVYRGFRSARDQTSKTWTIQSPNVSPNNPRAHTNLRHQIDQSQSATIHHGKTNS